MKFNIIGSDEQIPFDVRLFNASTFIAAVFGIITVLINLDWELPVMNGIDAIRTLKKNKSTHAIPVIMCTGVMMTSEDLQTSFNAGAIDYIRKPVDKTELIARTRSILMLSEYFSKKQKAEVTIHDLTLEIQDREIARLTTDLEFRNRELTAKAMYLLQNNELLSGTMATLEKIMSGKAEDYTGRIAALIKSLKMNRTVKAGKSLKPISIRYTPVFINVFWQNIRY